MHDADALAVGGGTAGAGALALGGVASWAWFPDEQVPAVFEVVPLEYGNGNEAVPVLRIWGFDFGNLVRCGRGAAGAGREITGRS